MICPICHGKGRTITPVTFGQGRERIEIPEIGPCENCFGQGNIHCCEGNREQAMVVAGEMVDGIPLEVNPNEAG